MNDIAACAAMIGIDEDKRLIVTACNNQFFRLTGAPVNDAQTFPVPLDAMVTDSVANELREKLLACFGSDWVQQAEQTHDIRKGSVWWRLSLKPIRHERNGTGVHEILMTGLDMSARIEQSQEPEVEASRYRVLVDLAYDAILTMDENHNITLFNRAAESLVGYTSAEVMGQPIVILLPERFRAGHPRRVKQFADSYQPTLRRATAPRMDETNCVYGQRRDGSIVPVEIAVSRIDLNGRVEFMAVVRDITDRARQMELLKEQATTDALTGLPNRRGFLQYIQTLLGDTDVFSVFILDIDFFKEINDEHGHDAGDEVLRVLAKVGASMTSRPCLFARWGGEEFVAALPGADASRAYDIADALRKRYERQDFAQVSRLEPIPFTVSIGVVTREAREADVDALMKRADRALYRAKRAGRNRVEAG